MPNFKPGDIVVSLIMQSTGHPDSEVLAKNDIRRVYGSMDQIWFKGDGKGAYSPSNFRFASPLEIRLFNEMGFTNIEYWVRRWKSGILTMGCKSERNYFKSLETYNNEGRVQKFGTYGLLKNGGIYHHELATKEQIEYFNRYETLATQEPQFQPGKWYKTIGNQFIVNKYIKFHSFDEQSKVIYTERITQLGEHNVFKAICNYQSTTIADPKGSLALVSDEEVAEYIHKIINQFPIY